MLLSPTALVVDPILSENRRKRSTLAPIVSNAWLSGFALRFGNFLKPLSCASYASYTSHFAIASAKHKASHCTAAYKARSSVKWGCVLRVVEHLPLLFDSVVKDQCNPEGFGADSWSRSNFTPRRNHMPPHLSSDSFRGVCSTLPENFFNFFRRR